MADAPAIKVRKRGSKRWDFLTPKGGVTHLRIHAAGFPTVAAAQAVVDASAADNPDWEWRAVGSDKQSEAA